MKLGAFAATGSGAMLSEAIHSLADTGNQYLLQVGIERSQAPATVRNPYGHSLERYVFGLMSGVGIFFLGCGVTVYHGLHLLYDPQPIEHTGLALGVMAAAGAVESYTLLVAVRSVSRAARESGMRFWDYVRDGPDPVGVAVLLEDGAAVAGVGVASLSIAAAHATQNPVWDAVGTLCVGTLLGGVGLALVQKNREMLVGRSVDAARLRELEAALERDPLISACHDVKATIMGPDDVRFKAELQFNGINLARKYIRMNSLEVERMPTQIGSRADLEVYLQVVGDGLVELLGNEIDRIEDIVLEHIPEARHVDIEVM
jgi:zinc transporter 9